MLDWMGSKSMTNVQTRRETVTGKRRAERGRMLLPAKEQGGPPGTTRSQEEAGKDSVQEPSAGAWSTLRLEPVGL